MGSISQVQHKFTVAFRRLKSRAKLSICTNFALIPEFARYLGNQCRRIGGVSVSTFRQGRVKLAVNQPGTGISKTAGQARGRDGIHRQGQAHRGRPAVRGQRGQKAAGQTSGQTNRQPRAQTHAEPQASPQAWADHARGAFGLAAVLGGVLAQLHRRHDNTRLRGFVLLCAVAPGGHPDRRAGSRVGHHDGRQ